MTEKGIKALDAIKLIENELMECHSNSDMSDNYVSKIEAAFRNIRDALTEPVNLVTGCHQGHTPSLVKAADEMLNEPVINDAGLAEDVEWIQKYYLNEPHGDHNPFSDVH